MKIKVVLSESLLPIGGEISHEKRILEMSMAMFRQSL